MAPDPIRPHRTHHCSVPRVHGAERGGRRAVRVQLRLRGEGLRLARVQTRRLDGGAASGPKRRTRGIVQLISRSCPARIASTHLCVARTAGKRRPVVGASAAARSGHTHGRPVHVVVHCLICSLTYGLPRPVLLSVTFGLHRGGTSVRVAREAGQRGAEACWRSAGVPPRVVVFASRLPLASPTGGPISARKGASRPSGGGCNDVRRKAVRAGPRRGPLSHLMRPSADTWCVVSCRHAAMPGTSFPATTRRAMIAKM